MHTRKMLELDLDGIRMDTFHATGEEKGVGTVHGHPRRHLQRRLHRVRQLRHLPDRLGRAAVLLLTAARHRSPGARRPRRRARWFRHPHSRAPGESNPFARCIFAHRRMAFAIQSATRLPASRVMHISRPPALRRFPRLVLVLFALLLGAVAAPGAAQAQPKHDHAGHGAHRPTPKVKNHHPAARRGVTAARVLRGEAVPSRAREAYTIAARIPGLLDALYCHCDCHERDGTRSLLECFEDDMATTCGICQGQARMASEMHADGKSLAEIRAALDQRWGG